MKRDSFTLPGLLCVITLGLILLAACASPQSGLARTDVPPYMPVNGLTPEDPQTVTPKPAEIIQLGSPISLDQAGFTFAPITQWDDSGQTLTLDLSTEQARLSNEKETLFFRLSSDGAGSATTTQACLDRIIMRMRQDMPDLAVSVGQPRLMAGQQSIATQLSGLLQDQKIHGLLSVAYTQQRCFSLLSLATGPDAEAVWSSVGETIDESLAAHLTWIDLSAQPTHTTCQISVDPTYGTDPNNPIRVGNRVIYDGLQREELYLSTLRGPGGEEVLFSRLAPRFNAKDEIVDVYEVRLNDTDAPIRLYFDTATYDQPMAIAGYTCEAAFPIQEP